MPRIDINKCGKAAALLAAGLLAALCAAPAQAQSSGDGGFYEQNLPKQFFLNKLVSPNAETQKEQAKEQAEQKQAEQVSEQTGERVLGQPAPRQYLLNRLFGSDGK